MENSVQINPEQLEEDLRNMEDPNPKTWYNEAVFKAVFGTILALEIAIFFFCIDVNGLVITFNTPLFLEAQKVEIVPVILAWNRASYSKSMENLKMLVAKKEATIVDAKDKEIKDLQTKTLALEKEKMELQMNVQLQKKELDVLSTEYTAMKDAIACAKLVTK